MVSARAWRTAELRGAAAARSVQDRLGFRDELRDGDKPLDVFAAIHKLGLSCLFQPLNSLLGAYVVYRGVKGLIVTTRRDLHIQRFTAAHELGHCELDHPTASLDTEVGFAARGPIPANNKTEDRDVREIEADAFAAEFLLPKWLVAAHIRRQGWVKRDLLKPDVAYQLSLRLAVSYSSTCWSLASNEFISRSAAEALVDVPPKKSKQRALPGFEPPTWHETDVWLLTKKDHGCRIVGDPHDRLVVSLEEHAAGGYRWDPTALSAAGLAVERDERVDPAVGQEPTVGDPVTRRLVISGTADSRITLHEHRPWIRDGSALNTFMCDLELLGPEPAGLPRVARRARA